MKSRLLGILIIFELIGLMLIISSCNPCRQVAKHPECFNPDTIKLTEYKTKYIKEVITNDSIVFDTIPCDPKTNTVYDTKTIYKTNWKTTIDTIYTAKEIDRINPVNIELEKTVKEQQKVIDKQKDKIKVRNKIILIESILLLIIALLVYIKKRL